MAQLSPIMTDAEVAALLGVAVRTFRKYVTHGPLDGSIDIREAEPQKFGGRRFWLRSRVEAVLGIERGETAARQNPNGGRRSAAVNTEGGAR